MSRLATVALATLLVSLVAGSARAQQEHQFLHNTNPANPLFECGPNTLGQVGCQAGVRCKCAYNAFGSAMQGLPPGYRWDCGLEQGTCMSDVPAATTGNYGSTPSPSGIPSIIVPYSSQGAAGKEKLQ